MSEQKQIPVTDDDREYWRLMERIQRRKEYHDVVGEPDQ